MIQNSLLKRNESSINTALVYRKSATLIPSFIFTFVLYCLGDKFRFFSLPPKIFLYLGDKVVFYVFTAQISLENLFYFIFLQHFELKIQIFWVINPILQIYHPIFSITQLFFSLLLKSDMF